ncbi:AcvB/VirJ family lysyl-phosphatidylglycerol hydrolase [Sphingomonas sp. RS2018]
MKQRWRQVAMALLFALVVGATGYLRDLGYPDGQVFTLVPATRVATPASRGTTAVFLSGDSGFNTGMGPRMMQRMADAGIPVVAVNSLTAFASRRTPQEAETLVEQAIAIAAALPGTRRVVLIGQSFGANIALAAVPTLPTAIRRRLAMVELVVPADTMLFRATPGGVFDVSHDGPALPYARRITGVPVLCIHGEVEDDSLCPIWRTPDVTSVALPGGHYLDHDDALVAATLLRALHVTIG